MAETIQSEGLVLHTLDINEHDKILTLFTYQQGLIKIFLKVRPRQAFLQQALTTPLTVGEYLYQAGRKELYYFRDGTIIEQHAHLRQHAELLLVAQQWIAAIRQSQWQEKAAPQLYVLCRLFLKELEQSRCPQTLCCSFFLKLLKHEGLLASSTCSICQIPLKESYRIGGEGFCLAHRPMQAVIFSEEEECLIDFLAHRRLLSDISSRVLPESFAAKISLLFSQIYEKETIVDSVQSF